MGNLFAQASAYLRAHKEYRRWLALFLCLALVIAAATTSLLTRPGVAMTHTERVLTCPFEGEAAHTHTEDCYRDGTLICPLPERELHTHTEACYSTEKTLICGEEESDGHVHTESCFRLVQGELTCTDESEEHVHTDDCYAWESVLGCGLEEGEGAHRHTDDCYTETDVLICGQEELLTEHVHGPGCFTEIVVEDEEPEATEEPAVEETAEPEPSETPSVTETGDPEADLEYYWMWAEAFSHVSLSGDWSEDLVTVARTQLGYTESARNYIIDESGRHGYTRYGAWYGLPYGDWCAMFASFCLNFAGIPREAMPWESATTRWVNVLSERGLFAAVDSGYVPKAGDLVFFTGPEYQEPVASHVGIVVEVSEGRISSIEGNNGPTVAKFDYELSDERIFGYGILPEEEKPDPADTPAETALAVITAADGSALPEDALPHAYPLTGREAEAAESAVEAWLAAPEAKFANAGEALARSNAAVQSTEVSETRYEVFEIGLDNVEETAYEGGFLVRVTLPDALTGRDFALFHLGDDGVEAVEAEYSATQNANGTETVTGFSFVTESFSPFVLRYTVDFHYEGGDGTSSDFSMSGGGFLTLPELVRGLQLVREGEEQTFLSAVANVEFSDPGLIWVGQAETDTTVGALKAELGLNSAYSSDLSADEIAAFDETAVAAGEWLLISLHPFDSPETLTITLNNGSVYSIDVTDARLVSYYLSDSGELYEVSVTYGENALIPDDATLKITEFEQDSAEYLEARKAVLAEMQERGVSVDPDTFGLAALDISILAADGSEIEPAAPVKVEMTIKALPGVENVEEIADTLVVRHHVETNDGVVVQSVYHGGTVASFLLDANPDLEPGMTAEPVSVDFATSSFSTFTVEWDNSGTASAHLRVSELANGKYILYAQDASNDSYYALVPSTALNSVPVTLNGNLVQYSGSENLYWDVEVSGNNYYFSFTENGRKYYLAAGTTGNRVVTRTSAGSYGSANTTAWQQWSDFIHSAGDTFLQSYNGTFRTWNVSGQSDWQNKSLIYFEKEGATVSGTHATIHYVDEEGNELTVSNGQPVNDTTGNLNYLIYDVDGYEYAYTYRNTDTNRITPILRSNNNKWQFTTGTNENGTNYNSWTDLSSGDEIYVVYKKRATVPQGGTPEPKIVGEKPPAPTITKESAVNGDGTNTLSLSVTGHTSVMEAEKLADVIVIYDVSGSMRYRMDSETNAAAGQRRMDYAQTATKALANSLLGKNTTAHPELIRMALISFSNTAQKVQDFTTDTSTFNHAVDVLPSPDGGTNWEQALKLANEMAVESDRATFVIFVTDGNPTFRQTRGVLNNSGTGSLGDNDVSTYYFAYNVYGVGSSDNHSRNYNAALAEAKSIVSHNKNFYTIGISNDVTNLTKLTTQAGAGADHSKTATSNAELVAAFDDIAASIIALMGQSDVQITDGITSLTQTVQKSSFVDYAEDDFTYYKGHAATSADVAAGLAAAEGDMVWESWTPSSEGCAEAVYDSATGAVKWNMGDSFMLMDGYTYQVRFKVWPSQEAYDLLARLNNGTIGWDDLTQEQRAQVIRDGDKYTLRTNEEHAGYSYVEATKTGSTVTPKSEPITGEFKPVDDLKLESDPLEVKKDWRASMVSLNPKPKKIDLDLLSMDSGTATSTYKTVTLSESNGWYSDNNFVSYGLVKKDGSTLSIYERGHDFTLEEKYDQDDNNDLLASHYWSFDPCIYRPMVIGEGATTRKTVLERVSVDGSPALFSGTAPMFWHDSGNADTTNPLYAANMRTTYNSYTGDYYWLPDANGVYHAYIDTGSNIILLATNKQRSYVDLIKRVDSDEACDEYFTFTGKIIVNTEGMTDKEIQVNREDIIWASIYDENGQRVDLRTLPPGNETNFWSPSEIDADYARYDKDYRFVFDAGKDAENGTDNTFIFAIKAGWSVRFLNLPNGSTVEFNETDIPDGYAFNSADLTVKRLEELTNHVVTETLAYSEDNTRVTGTIAEADAGYTVTYHNGPQADKTQIKVEKQWSDSGHEADTIDFTVYQKAVTADDTVVREIEYRTGTITGNGSVTLDGLPKTGWLSGQSVTFEYSVVETSGKEGYVSAVDYTKADSADPTSVDTYTIRNIKQEMPRDKDTSVSFTKQWLDSDGHASTRSHDGDSIQVKLIQEAVDSGYVPVTLRLINGNNSQYGPDQIYYVSKGSTVTLTAERSRTDSGHTVSVNGSALSGSGTSFTYSISNVSSELTIEAKVDFSYSNTRYDSWGTTASATSRSGGSYYTYVWKPTFTVTAGTESPVDEIIEAAKSNTVKQTQEFIYTLSKDALSDGPFTESVTADWVGKVEGLPLFQKIDDSTFYAYYYSVEELSVNGETIRPKPTGAAAGVVGQTDEYIVSVDQETMTITNTEKETVNITVTKQWQNAGGVTIDAPEGAEVMLELYRDGAATGLRILLNGLKDVKEGPAGEGEELNPYLIEAKTYEVESWTATWKDLIQYRDDGTAYAYTVKEIAGYTGFEAVTGSAVDGGIIVNRKPLKDFSFSKAWIPINSTVNTVNLTDLMDWGADRTISVTLWRSADPDIAEPVCSYVLRGTGTFLPTDDTLSAEEKAAYALTAVSDGKLVTFTMGKALLPETDSGIPYTYFVVEDNAAPGIYNTYYGDREGSAVKRSPGRDKAFDGQVILNHEISGYELPATGGVGTLGYRLCGVALIGAALAGLLLRKIRRRAKGGGQTV